MARVMGVQPYGKISLTFGARRFPKGERKPLVRPASAYLLPLGTDAPTMARVMGVQPYGKISLTFGARRLPKGNEGKRVSSGYNRRRRLATRSSGKQQAERTAVRTAPIVCPEESPLVRPQAQTFCRWGLTRRLRRGRWGCRPDGGSYFLSARKKVPKKASGTALRKKGSYCPF